MTKSKIEWTEHTWNPIVGCSIVSPGCTNCYAMKMANRHASNPSMPAYHGTIQPSRAGPVWTGKVALAEKALLKPLNRRKPTTYFVNSMGDLFHEDVPDDWIDQVFAVMALCPQHTFQVLTKRAERMREYFARLRPDFGRLSDAAYEMEHSLSEDAAQDAADALDLLHCMGKPLPNVWLGVSAEDQTRADERIPALLNTPAAIRFVSCEPLLGPISLSLLRVGTRGPGRVIGDTYDALTGEAVDSTYLGYVRRQGGTKLDWVIVGGESGPKARPMHPDWARSLRDQCKAAEVPFFFKQWGEWALADANHCPDSYMGTNAAKWLGEDGRQQKPSHLGLPNPVGVIRVGKRTAGRQLDGREWNEVPE